MDGNIPKGLAEGGDVREICEACESKDLYPVLEAVENTGFQYEMVCCRACGLIQLSRVISEGRKGSLIWEGEFWDKPDLSYEQGRMGRHKKLLSLLKRYEVTGGQLLDVGCSFGGLLNVAMEMGFSVCGVDVSPVAIDYLRSECHIEAFYSVVDAAQKKGLFDVVVCRSTLFYFRSPIEALRHMRDALKPKGLLVIETQINRAWIIKLIKRMEKFCGRKLVSQSTLQSLIDSSFYSFGTNNLTFMLQRAGFNIIGLHNSYYGLLQLKPTLYSTAIALAKAVLNVLSFVIWVASLGHYKTAPVVAFYATRD